MQEDLRGKVPEHFSARPTRSKRLNSLPRLRKLCPRFPSSRGTPFLSQCWYFPLLTPPALPEAPFLFQSNSVFFSSPVLSGGGRTQALCVHIPDLSLTGCVTMD